MDGAGGKFRLRALLYLRHHRPAQGRALFPSQQHAHRADCRPILQPAPEPLDRDAAGGADVPCQWLGDSLSRPDDRSQPGVAGAEAGRRLIYELLETERVTVTAAVPTVWLDLLQYLDQNGLKLSNLKRVCIGGAAAPRALIGRFEDSITWK